MLPRPPPAQDALDLLRRARAGERGALARLITRIEARAPGSDAVLAAMTPRRKRGPGAPHVVGLTGPPGAGKSTIVDALLGLARARGQRVGVVAVDPSSPRTGGAILGDRIRMEGRTEDPGVYLRSLSARGHAGGLSRATGQIVELLDDVGYDLVLVETVGVGQGELAVLEVADTVLVVLTPESGDTVQTMKAGLLEIADAFVVNKADRPGAEHLVRDLELSVHLDSTGHPDEWATPVLSASALRGEGVPAILAALDAHRAWIASSGRTSWERRRAAGARQTFLDLCAEDAREVAARWLAGSGQEAALLAGDVRPEQLATRSAWASP